MTISTAAWEGRKLLRTARVGTLATVSAGQPFGSLVTPALAADLSVLLLLSDLSEHTRHLRAEPRCSVLVVGTQADANPQTTPRITITGLAEVVDDAVLKARYLAVHPYASVYAGFSDFSLWRIRPANGLYVGGFGRAARLGSTILLPDPRAVATIDAEASDIIARYNADHAAALAVIAGRPGDWQIVAVDVDGCDLANGEQVVRVHWTTPAADASQVCNELAGLARGAGAG